MCRWDVPVTARRQQSDNMVQLEELGLLKMDFLGLRTLTVLKDAVKNVKASKGIDIDIDHIDLNE